jgi:hypothetical protein
MKIVMIARWTGWIQEPPFERQYRYPMFAAAHAVSLIKNGGLLPQDIYVISDIQESKYLDFLNNIGVKVWRTSSNLQKFTKCIEVAKEHPEEIICWVDSDMYLFGKVDFNSAVKDMLGESEMLVGDGGSFDAKEKIIKSTKQWDPNDFYKVWGFTIEELIEWSVEKQKKWCLGVVYALKSQSLINYEKQMDRNSYDELLAFALSKLIKTEYLPSKNSNLIVKGIDSSLSFYLKNPHDPNSAPEDFYWVHYGGGSKVLDINTHLNDFCNNVIENYNIG